MPMPSKNSRIKTLSTPARRVKFIAMALPLAVTIGCGQNSRIIDYTISQDEYAALTEPAPAAAALPEALEQIAAAEDIQEIAQPASAEIVLASAPPKLPEFQEPVMAAALPEEPLLEPLQSLDTSADWSNAELPNSSWQEKTVMTSAKPAAGQDHFTGSTVTSEMIASEMTSAMAPQDSTPDAAAAALEATAALEAKVAQLEALTTADPDFIVAKEPVLASAIDIDRLGFTPGIYTTIGLGVSRMNPDTSAAEGWEPNDITEPAGQIGLGVDLGRFLSLEAHSGDYGSTSLNPEGRINYHVHGVSALIYAGKNLDRFRRRGFNGYARIGYNQVENTNVGDTVPFLERTTNHASFGIGAEYTTRWGLGLRGDLIAYDGDVQYGQLGILYRLASKPSILPKLAAASDAPATQPVIYPQINTETPAAKPEFAMQEPGEAPKNAMAPDARFSMPRYTTEYAGGDECTRLNGTLSNVNFMNGSAELTYDARVALDSVANTLMDCEDRQFVVSAHTDSNGSAVANDALSKRRARAVAMHLVGRGVDMSRMLAVAYGESRPVASNATHEGRTRNRRVELEVR